MTAGGVTGVRDGPQVRIDGRASGGYIDSAVVARIASILMGNLTRGVDDETGAVVKIITDCSILGGTCNKEDWVDGSHVPRVMLGKTGNDDATVSVGIVVTDI